MFKLIKKIFKIIEKPVKDPMDWSLTKSSTNWITDQYCPQCKSTTGHEDRMSNICHNCGFMGNMRNYRSYRKIWNGSKWVRQFKYSNLDKDYILEEL